MKNIIIIGAGGFGRELLQWIKDINKIENALISWTRGNIDLEPLIKAAPFKIKF